jgi:hypothetical protein
MQVMLLLVVEMLTNFLNWSCAHVKAQPKQDQKIL